MPCLDKKKDTKRIEAMSKVCLIAVLDVLSVAIC